MTSNDSSPQPDGYSELDTVTLDAYTGSQADGMTALLDMSAPAPEPARELRRRGRFGWFSLIGGTVFVIGVIVQWVLVHSGAGDYGSYAGQAVVSIELNFLLNRTITWRDRDTRFWPACWRFTAQRAVMTVPNLAIYSVLVTAGANWLAANIGTTAVFTIINFFIADRWSFAKRGTRAGRHAAVRTGEAPVLDDSRRFAPRDPASLHGTPTVSVVVPCKDNHATIRETVHALLGQDYPALAEVILVGSVGDSTWKALIGMDDPRLTFLEQGYVPGARDPAVKRDKGLRKASGEILALADSDIVMEPGWLSAGVAELQAGGGGVVAGGMRSIHDTFWGRFVDRNRLARKTPRLPKPYLVTAENFGRRNNKPPVTANMIFTRDVYDSAPFDITWMYGYEDYEWCWRIAKAGHRILLTSELDGRHHHRRSFRQLAREYARAADGCARFVRVHPDSPLSRKRLAQAIGIPIAAVLGLAAAVVAVTLRLGLEALGAGTVAAAGLVVREYKHARKAESLAYPIAGVALGAVFTVGLIASLARPGRQSSQCADANHVAEPRWRRTPRALVAILALQAGLSLILVWSNTAFGDEAHCLWYGRQELAHWLHGAPLISQTQAFSGAAFIWPPLAAAASNIGGLAAARILALLFILGATVLLHLAASRLFSRTAATAAVALWAFSEPGLTVGPYATYDAMSVFLMAFAAWLVIRAGTHRRHAELATLAALTAVLSGVVAFTYFIFVPVIVLLGFAVWVPSRGFRRAFKSAAWTAGAVALFTTGLLSVLKLWAAVLLQGVTRSGVASREFQGMFLAVTTSWAAVGLVAVLAVASVAVAAAVSESRDRVLSLAVLASATFLVPLYQVHLETDWDMWKHVSLGLWFASIPAGVLIGRLISIPQVTRQGFLACAAVVALMFPAVNGWQSAWAHFHSWPNAAPLISRLRPLVATNHGPFYMNGAPTTVVSYYEATNAWDNNGALPTGLPSDKLRYYDMQIAHARYGLVTLVFPGNGSGASLLERIALSRITTKPRQLLLRLAASSSTPGLYYFAAALESNPSYRLVAEGPYDSETTPNIFVVWRRTG